MGNNRLGELIELCLRDEASVSERTEMMALIREKDQEENAKNLILAALEADKPTLDISEQSSAQILHAIFQSNDIQPVQKVRPELKKVYVKWASIAAILAISFWFVFYQVNSVKEKAEVLVSKHDAKPATHSATLTLADGSVIALSEIKNGRIATQSGIVVTKDAEGTLRYSLEKPIDPKIIGMNTVSTPYGGQYKVLLPDGSKVYLNAGSTISYPFFFDQKTRSVSLSGEAYFEVAKDKSRPFVVSVPRTVNVPDQKITVLGTHFNISAYPDERAYTTTLLEGSVKVSSSEKNISEVLVPGQQAVLAKTLKIGPADTDGALAWKNGVFYFANQPIDRVMRELERWYNIEVQYQGEMPRVGFWGQISRNKMLSDVLRDLEYTNSIHFKIEGRRVTVMQ
jgi:hypothetical protein